VRYARLSKKQQKNNFVGDLTDLIDYTDNSDRFILIAVFVYHRIPIFGTGRCSLLCKGDKEQKRGKPFFRRSRREGGRAKQRPGE
jgi:hypothetical protein